MMKIIKIPEGQTEYSFRNTKISNIERTIEMFKCISDDKECFDIDTKIELSIYEVQLLNLLKVFKGTKE